ncbi:hypothetical protein KC19_7G008200 [Ceratodon purpureus]|uniref:Uncharacterized protein n=1 Tax=Ceratodon purpureus TaxID=3225 RepID=A0A8T0H4N1_CERPU|nr:hypothetical protein KC19_7G008200 [Ceratodon purpureus]
MIFQALFFFSRLKLVLHFRPQYRSNDFSHYHLPIPSNLQPKLLPNLSPQH